MKKANVQCDARLSTEDRPELVAALALAAVKLVPELMDYKAEAVLSAAAVSATLFLNLTVRQPINPTIH